MSDYLRYALLFERGGICCDCDMLALRPFTNIAAKKCVKGKGTGKGKHDKSSFTPCSICEAWTPGFAESTPAPSTKDIQTV